MRSLLAEALPLTIVQPLAQAGLSSLQGLLDGVSLLRLDLVFDIKQVNLVNIYVNQNPSPPPSLIAYKEGVEKSQRKNYKSAVRYYSDALGKDGNFAEAYVSH